MASQKPPSVVHNARKRRAETPVEFSWLTGAHFNMLGCNKEDYGGGRIVNLLEHGDNIEGFMTPQKALRTARLSKLSEKFRLRADVRDVLIWSIEPRETALYDDGDLLVVLLDGLNKQASSFVFAIRPRPSFTILLMDSSVPPTPAREPSAESPKTRSVDLDRDSVIDYPGTGAITASRDDGVERRVGDDDTFEPAVNGRDDDPDGIYKSPTPRSALSDADPMEVDEGAITATDVDDDGLDTVELVKDMDRNFEEEQSALASRRLRTRIDDPLVELFCRFFLLPRGEFNPSKEMPVPGILGIPDLATHARSKPKTYQVFTAFFMADHERKHTLHDSKLGTTSFGGIIAHDPGLGKTLCAVIAWNLNLRLVLMQREIARERQYPGKKCKHLQADCPDDATCSYGRARFGFQCLCEPQSVAHTLHFFNGATVCSVKSSLVEVWLREFDNSVDRSYFEELITDDHKACGRQGKLPQVCIVDAHTKGKRRERTVSGDSFFSDRNSPYVYRAYNMADWRRANGTEEWLTRDVYDLLNTSTDTALASQLLHGTIKKGDIKLCTPARPDDWSDLLPATVVLITTYGCLRTRVIQQSVSLIPSETVTFACEGDSCDKRKGSAKAHPATHRYKFDGLQFFPLQIARIIVDEAHNIQSEDTAFISNIRGMIRDSLTFFRRGPSLWPFTGTPWSKSPFDLIAYLEAQQVHPQLDHWSQVMTAHPKLRHLKQSAIKAAQQEYEELRHLEEETFAVAGSAHEQSQLEPTHRQKADKAVETLLDLIMKIRCTDEWDGEPILALPPQHMRCEQIEVTRSEQAVLEHHLKEVKEFHKAMRAAGNERDTRSSRTFSAARKKATDSYGRLSKALCFLNLSAIETQQVSTDQLSPNGTDAGGSLATDQNKTASATQRSQTCAASEYINKHNLWDRKEGNPYFENRKELYDNSPKARWLVKYYQQMELVDFPKHGSHPDGTGERGTSEGRPQVIIAVKTPSVACALLHALRYGLSDHLEDEQIVALHSGLKNADRHEVISRYQQERSPEQDIKILVLLVRVAGEGVTLTRAHTLFHFEIEPQLTTFEQTSGRAWRFGRVDDFFNVQLMMVVGGFEQMRLQLRERIDAQHKQILDRERKSGKTAQATGSSREAPLMVADT